ncbi:hypothetical protein F5Y19DRAFT_416058 [Xylariaceae sp. FL1651]|nr:hypothetical protein F5Y19DRAFT_416058 [Xylariaceae sp. FL1651]
MDEIDIFVELTSPSTSASSTYGCDTDLYLDSTSSSTAISPMTSPHDLPFADDYPSSEHTEGTTDKSQPGLQEPASKPAPKRKRENRYKNAPPSVLCRRRAQNRASQRAYRERKDQRIKDLEVLLSETQQKNESLSQACANLQAEIVKLKSQQATQIWPNSLAWDPTITPPQMEDMGLLYLGDQTTGYSI